MDAPHPQQLQSSRRLLVSGLVAAAVLAAGWLLPSAYADGDAEPATGIAPVATQDE
ncbi:hypothetical protein [Streptomyces sp. 7-21]|uniref:hypothetical protein n=1 Tax=Streptomyces sp. 7-21 TaxID=2802283 RepID=UPI00191DF303|nr:hypothetical protein [Streptomyces sp. 7-21]MBL1065774.1 hypothetical protein [Streptomyces sp. 7-21]